jgi:cation:H+ antiporter
MIIEIALAIIGLFLILKGSELVTDAAVPLARFLDTTYVAVGLVLVSVLLSLPELLVSVSSMLKGHSDVGVGVIIGSIIVNLGLIIGISAVIRPLRIPRHVITRDAVFMLIATMVVSLIVLEDFQVTQRDGAVFLLLFIPYLINIWEQEKALALKERRKESEMITKTLQFTGKIGGIDVAIQDTRVILLAGIAMLLLGAEWFTSSLIFIAGNFGIPEMLIGLTLGALGPSIPNLAAALQAVRRGYDELAISETIGSNIFTLLITLGILAITRPFQIDVITAVVTAPALLIVTVVFFVFTLKGTITRIDGATLIALYLIAMAAEIFMRIGG